MVERDGNWRGPSGERIEEKMFGFNSGAGNVNHISCENWERFMKYPRPREARLFQIAFKLRTVGWNGGAELSPALVRWLASGRAQQRRKGHNNRYCDKKLGAGTH